MRVCIRIYINTFRYVTIITMNQLSDQILSNVVQVKSDLSCYNPTTMLL
jgi:hypothetical protein